jgi:hypothetical protein
MTRAPQSRFRRPAFTLVEAIGAMVVISIATGATVSLVGDSVMVYRDAAAQVALQADANAAMERLIREIRMIPSDLLSGVVVPRLTSLTATDLRWDTGGFTLDGSTLRAGVGVPSGSPGAEVLSGVTALAFRPLAADGSLLAFPLGSVGLGSVRQVEIDLTVSRAGQSERLRTRVALRSAGLLATVR